MIGQYYLERYYSRGASRTLTARQMRALERAELALPGAGAGAR
jgi:polar amino acid transport system permease protein